MRETDRVIGFRETVKMLKQDRVRNVILATDSDTELKEEIESRCAIRAVPVERVKSKAKLGQFCGIERPAAVMAFLKESDELES